MIRDKKIIIQILATKYNLPLKKVEEMVNHQFKFTEKIMKKGDFDSVRLPYFGKFSVNPNRVKHINKLKSIKDE
jgi:nucleoid DNA-binding protein|tara:strand:+ start:1168 stop:1389 length:222 start_codon:yes stop_codon:yes gene_type:complete